MAEAADNILSKILEESNKHNDLLAATMLRNEQLHKDLVKIDSDAEKADARQEDFAKKQQGQEVQFSKKNQFYSDQIRQQTDELEALQFETAEIQGVSSEHLEDIKDGLKTQRDEARETAKTTFENQKAEASRWGTMFSKQMEDAKSVDNLLGAMKTDVSLIFGSTATLTQIPGIQSALTGIKMIAAGILSWLMVFINKIFPGLLPWFKKLFFNKAAVRKKAKEEWLATKKLERAEKQKDIKVDTGIIGPDGKPLMRSAKGTEGPAEVDEKDYKPEKEGAGFITKAFAAGGFAVMMKSFGMSITRMIKKVIWPKIMGVMATISGAFTALAVALGVPVGVLGLIIAGIVLVVIGLFIFWDKISTFFSETLPNWWTELTEVKIPKMWDDLWTWIGEKWDSMIAIIQETWAKAKEKLKGWGAQISQFFSDFKTQAWLNLQEMFVSVLEGIQSAINWVISKVNKIPGVEIDPVDFAGSMRTDLDADKAAFAAEKAARGDEIATATTAVKNADTNRLPAAVAGNNSFANVNNVQQSQSNFVIGTGSSDGYARAAAANA